MREQKNTFAHHTALAFLLMIIGAGLLSTSLKKQFDDDQKKITLTPFEVFNRKKVNSASSIYQFLDNTVDRAVGVCNVDKAKLPTYNAFIFDRVAVRMGTAATSGSPVAGGVNYDDSLLAALETAEFEIVQNGRVVLDLPMIALHNSYEATATSIADQYAQLGSFCYLVDDSEFTWNIKFASGVSVEADTTNSHFLEVRLGGWKANKRAFA